MQRYVVGFTIFDGRALQTEDGDSCDAFVVVECCNQTYQSQTFEGMDALVPWHETEIWPDIDLYPKEFEAAYIEFKVYSRHWFTRNYLIGKQALQLSFVNKRRHHLYARRDLTLRREDSPDCTGTLNVTVFCLKPGELAPGAQEMQLPSGDDEDEDAGGKDKKDDTRNLNVAVQKCKVDMPPGKDHYVNVNIHRIDELTNIYGYAPSPYVTIEFAGCLLSTVVASNESRYDFNSCAQIPVTTPVYEDNIVIKLWTRNWMSSDQQLAQGIISFSELRNTSLQPTWFNLYGWNDEEVPDKSFIATSGAEMSPNEFIGRLLISGHVAQLEDDETLQAAALVPGSSIEEPQMMPTAIFADVYMVIGADGRSCQVEVGFRTAKERTKEVYPWTEADQLEVLGHLSRKDRKDEDRVQDESESTTIFRFDPNEGRVKSFGVLTPEKEESQAFVMISVFTRSYGTLRRIGFVKKRLRNFSKYVDGEPTKPTFIPLDPMPMMGLTRHAPSVLLTINTHNKEDQLRHRRKEIKPMIYLVRAYCFMGRQISFPSMRRDTESSEYGVRVACAGKFKSTKLKQGPRPMWMEPLQLNVLLFSDSTKTDPTIEPITVTLEEGGTVNNVDLGKAVCVYTHIRKKDTTGNWEPFKLDPQWIRILGGPYGNTPVGELLVDFELLLLTHQDQPELQVKDMYPKPEREFDELNDYCRLKKATIHFSLNGLRDLLPLAKVESMNLGTAEVTRPRVSVSVSQMFDKHEGYMQDYIKDEHREAIQGEPLRFEFTDAITGGNPKLRSERLESWTSKIGLMGNAEGKNFEFFAAGKQKVLIPEDPRLEPYVTIRVEEMPSGKLDEYGQNWLGYKPTLIGESLQNLAPYLPCCWLPGVNLDQSYFEPMSTRPRHDIRDMLEKRKKYGKAGNFVQKTDQELQQQVRELTKLVQEMRRGDEDDTDTIKREEDEDDVVDNKAIPRELRNKDASKRPIRIRASDLNVQFEEPMTPCYGPTDRQKGSEVTQGSVDGKLEDSAEDGGAFAHDFWYKSKPLLRNHDFTSPDDKSTDWNFQPGRTFGFVKCCFKLVDGWDEEETEPNVHPGMSRMSTMISVDPTGTAVDEKEQILPSHERLRMSYEVDDLLNSFAFDTEKFRKKYKDDDRTPARVRVRLYLVKAVCIYEKFRKKYKDDDRTPARVRVRLYLVKAVCIYGKSSGFADPYLDFQLGYGEHVSMKNMVRHADNTPEFYRFEERICRLPQDCRLEVRLMDLEDLGSILGDSLIGGTTIDLEDRWHSPKWKHKMEGRLVPQEHRPLYSPQEPGKVRGTMTMWIEMLSVDTDLPPSKLAPPPATEVEVRLVIWSTANVKIISGEYVNIMVSTNLSCKEYLGDCDRLQSTDTHFNSFDGRGVFNWRMVYPRIRPPTFSCNLQVKAFHHEVLGDTEIGSFDLDLNRYIGRVAMTLERITVGPSDIKIMNADTREAGDDADDIGSINMTLYVLSQVEALSKPQGLGWEEPNNDPLLLTPTEGRDWGTYLAALGLSLDIDWKFLLKKMIPVVLAGVGFFVTLITLKMSGLL